MHMQYSGGNGVSAPGSWEIALPDKTYSVTVAVGDAGAFYDSSHRLTVEGQALITGFVPTAAQRHATAQANLDVSDGRLTVDPTGGSNTKIDYIEIRDPEVAPPPPPPPSTFTAISWSKVAPAPALRSEAGGAVVGDK